MDGSVGSMLRARGTVGLSVIVCSLLLASCTMRWNGMSARFSWPAPSEPSLTFEPSTAFARIFRAVTAFFLIFAVVTALALSCFLPTLFLPSWLAARAAPPQRSTKAVSEETTVA